MKKNIEFQGGGVQCDNPKCDYVDPDVPIDQYEEWVNKPCPKCGENLFTEDDYIKFQLMLKAMDFVNSLDLPSDPTETMATMKVDVHNEKIDIIDIESPYDQKKIDEKIAGGKRD